MDTRHSEPRRADDYAKESERSEQMKGSNTARAVARVLFWPSLLATVFAGLVWMNNVSIARARNRDIADKRTKYIERMEKLEQQRKEQERMAKMGLEVPEAAPEEAAETVPQPNGFMKRPNYGGWFGSEILDWFGVDFSTFTTFIPFFGLIFITWGLHNIARGTKRKVTEHFPFFKKYITITVTMGFVGTVWGLINVFKDPTVNLSNVAMCLDTALYSTLVGLVWSFFIAWPLSCLMFWAYKKAWNIRGDEKKDFVQLFNALASAVSATVERLEAIVKSSKGFEGFVKGVTGELETLKGTLGDMSGDIKGFFRVGTDTMTKMGEESEVRKTTTTKQLGILEKMDTRLDAKIQGLERRLAQRDQQLAAERKRAEEAEQAKAKAESQRAEANRRAEEARKALEAEAKARKAAEARVTREAEAKTAALAHARELEGTLANIGGIASKAGAAR